jgi:hypothetical protein
MQLVQGVSDAYAQSDERFSRNAIVSTAPARPLLLVRCASGGLNPGRANR